MRTAAIPLLLFLAVAFYGMTDGADSPATLGSYSTAELIVDRSAVSPTRSHYTFTTGDPGLVDPYGHVFELVTVDGVRYRFDITTAKVVIREQLQP